MVPIEPVNVTLSRRSIMQKKFRWLQNISSQNAKFRSPFLLGKNGCRSVYNWTFGVELFWNQRNYFCIIERRDRVTFTGSIGTIFGGTNPKNYDFSPKCRRPPPKSTIFGMGLSSGLDASLFYIFMLINGYMCKCLLLNISWTIIGCTLFYRILLIIIVIFGMANML